MPKVATFITLFDQTRREHGDDECYISYDPVTMQRRSISFQELWLLASRFAYNLKQLGVERGDNVAVATPLSIEYVVASFGVIFAGGVQVSMEKIFAKCEIIKKTINMAKVKFMLMSDTPANETWPFFEMQSKRESGCQPSASFHDVSLPSLKKIVFTNRCKDSQDSNGFLDHLKKCHHEYRDDGLDPEDSCISPASLNPGVATPKLVELSHRAIVNTAKLYHKRFSFLKKIHLRWPWYISATIPYDALNGVPRVITDSFSKMAQSFPEHCVDVVKKEGLTSGLMSPIDFKGIADISQSSDKVFMNVLSGGQPMTKAIFEVAQQISTNVHIVYFVSECSYVTCNDIGPDDDFTPFDSGYPLEGVEVRIVDENNKELPKGQTGRIIVRSPYLFTRYTGQPELTESVWGEDGWFYSGDAGCLSSNGHLHVYGRQGDVISRGIVLTYPSWIEKPIWKISDVVEVMAVPVPDDINFQGTCACVVLRPGSKITVKDILKTFEEGVTEEGSGLIYLDHVVLFEGALPKLARDKLGEVAAEKLGLKK